MTPFRGAVIFFLFGHSSLFIHAQNDAVESRRPHVEINGGADVFYVHDFNRPVSKQRLPFIYNHNRHAKPYVNQAYIRLVVDHARYRMNVALHTGTYITDNYAQEPGLLKYLFEANAGVALNRKRNVWLDAGIFSSHIGFESAVSADNPTLTRSLLADNSPYYLAGAKIQYRPNAKWEIVALVCNGWQRIQPVKGNSLPSFGTQLRFYPTGRLTLNWSTFIGTDDPDSSRRMRYFNNLYAQIQLTKMFSMVAGVDVGVQQISKGGRGYHNWFSPVLIFRGSFSDKWALAVRGEYYQDIHGVIIATGTPNGFKTTGASLNLDYAPVPYLLCRMEGRWLHSRDSIFEKQGKNVRNNFSVAVSVAVRFQRLLQAVNI